MTAKSARRRSQPASPAATFTAAPPATTETIFEVLLSHWKQSFVSNLELGVNCGAAPDCDGLVVGCAIYVESSFYCCAAHLPEDGKRFGAGRQPSTASDSSAAKL